MAAVGRECRENLFVFRQLFSHFSHFDLCKGSILLPLNLITAHVASLVVLKSSADIHARGCNVIHSLVIRLNIAVMGIRLL